MAVTVVPQCPVAIYRGGMECGSGKEAELPVLGDTGSHCHTVTVGTTHAVVVDRWWWSVGRSRAPRFVVDRGVGGSWRWPDGVSTERTEHFDRPHTQVCAWQRLPDGADPRKEMKKIEQRTETEAQCLDNVFAGRTSFFFFFGVRRATRINEEKTEHSISSGRRTISGSICRGFWFGDFWRVFDVWARRTRPWHGCEGVGHGSLDSQRGTGAQHVCHATGRTGRLKREKVLSKLSRSSPRFLLGLLRPSLLSL